LGPRKDQYAITEVCIRDTAVAPDFATFADCNATPDNRIRANPRAVANFGGRANDNARAEGDAGTDHC
jgi:hypothetical protein